MQTGTQTTEFLHLNNPQNYKYLPSRFAVNIKEAGLPKEKVFDTEKERWHWYKKKDAPVSWTWYDQQEARKGYQ